MLDCFRDEVRKYLYVLNRAFCTVLCVILTNSVRNFHLLLKKKKKILEFNEKNRASRSPNPIPAVFLPVTIGKSEEGFLADRKDTL